MSFLAVGVSAGLVVTGTTGKLIMGANAKSRARTAQSLANDAFDKQMKLYKSFQFENKFSNLRNTAADAQNFAADLENFGVGVQQRADNLKNFSSQMENVAEDLTVNRQQADFLAQQQQQALANTLSSVRGAAGSSGVGALAQSLAAQQSQNLQSASASIGQQETANQRLQAQQAARIQSMTAQEASRNQAAGLNAAQFQARMAQANQMASVQAQTRNQELQIQQEAANQMAAARGEFAVQGMEFDRRSTLLGMTAEQVGAANQQMQAARQMQADAFTGLVSAGGSIMGSAIPNIPGGVTPPQTSGFTGQFENATLSPNSYIPIEGPSSSFYTGPTGGSGNTFDPFGGYTGR
tara:strand:- start:1081 stop:2136 length:1056 start_codon:yes stop_codon:yes gene_type:complete